MVRARKTSQTRGLSALAVGLAIPALYISCSCFSGAQVNVAREIARDVRAVRATGSTCDSPVVKCFTSWSEGGCALWTIEVASPGTCEVVFELAKGAPVTRTIVFRTVDGCMCGGNIVADTVQDIARVGVPIREGLAHLQRGELRLLELVPPNAALSR